MPSQVRDILEVVVASAVIAGFAMMFGVSIYRRLKDQDTNENENYIYVATALAGLVGGIVATAFGQQLPAAANTASNPVPVQQPVASGNSLNPIDLWQDWTGQQRLFAIYGFVYVILGILAIFTWAVRGKGTGSKESRLVTNLASVSIGLFVAVAQALFTR